MGMGGRVGIHVETSLCSGRIGATTSFAWIRLVAASVRMGSVWSPTPSGIPIADLKIFPGICSVILMVIELYLRLNLIKEAQIFGGPRKYIQYQSYDII
jgi:hypothetical protein